MFTFDVDLPPWDGRPEIHDVRGGRVMMLDASSYYNNLHTPYRGGDWNMVPIAPNGIPTGYLWMLPYADTNLEDVSTRRAITALKAKATKNTSGYNAQVWADGMTFSVTQNG